MWLKGTPEWVKEVRIGPSVVGHKRRRISAFMRLLPSAWPELQECFRIKYSLKLRRETQRLILLESGFAVPPTKVLDKSWAEESPTSICNRLRQLAPNPDGRFFKDLMLR